MFVLTSSIIGLVAVVPLLYLARQAGQDAKEIRDMHTELASLVQETKELGANVHRIQHEIRDDQREAKSDIADTRKAVERVSETVERVRSAGPRDASERRPEAA